MGNYYYLGAQLPYLVYGQAVPMSAEAFKAMAAEKLDAPEKGALDYCVLKPGVKATAWEFVNKWQDWEKSLRLNLAKGRAAKLKREAPDAPDYPADAAAAAKLALQAESPLEAEIALDKARWAAIDGFAGIGQFTENAIYAYLLKLRLMERRLSFKTEEGFNEYKTLYASILKAAETGEPK